MLTILGVKVSYETASFIALFLASEVLGNSKRFKANSVVQAVLSAVNYMKLFRTEDDRIARIKKELKG